MLGNLPPLNEVEGVPQPQSPQHEQETENRPLSGTQHQGLRQEQRHMLYQGPRSITKQGPRSITSVSSLLEQLLDLLKHCCAVDCSQSRIVVEVLKDLK